MAYSCLVEKEKEQLHNIALRQKNLQLDSKLTKLYIQVGMLQESLEETRDEKAKLTQQVVDLEESLLFDTDGKTGNYPPLPKREGKLVVGFNTYPEILFDITDILSGRDSNK